MGTARQIRRGIRFSLVLCGMMAAGCASSALILEDIPATLKQLDISVLPDQKDYPDADAVMILDLTHNQVMVEHRDLVTYETRHVIKKIFRNTNEQSTVTLFVLPDEELLEIKARTVRPDGQYIPLQPTDYYTISGMGGASILYADIRTVRFTFPAVEKGCLIEYTYLKRKNEPFVRDVWQVQHDIPTLRNQYSLSMPKLMVALALYRWKMYPDSQQIRPMADSAQMMTSRLSAPVTFTWARRDVPAFTPEEMMPPAELFQSHVRFALTSWRGWDGIASWYDEEFFRPQLIVTDSIRMLAEQLTAADSSLEGKIKSIYTFVQNIRYVAIQLGESGLEPSPPQTVLQRRYGDCKDKSMLCIALLQALGVDASPVLVLTADEGRVDPQFPSWHFNHMIVKAQPSAHRTIWMDPTSEFSPFDTLPWEDQANPVLAIYGNGHGGIEWTPKPDYNANLLKYGVDIALLNNGQARVVSRIRCSGEQARHYRMMFAEKSTSEITDLCKETLLDHMTRVEVDSVKVDYLTEIDSALTLTMDFRIPNALQQQGDLFYFDPNIYREEVRLQWTAKDTRRYPIWFPSNYTVLRNTTVHVSDTTLVIASVPKTVSFQNSDFSYANTIEQKNPYVMKASEVLLMKQAMLPASKFRDMKEFFQNIKQSMERPIFLRKR